MGGEGDGLRTMDQPGQDSIGDRSNELFIELCRALPHRPPVLHSSQFILGPS